MRRTLSLLTAMLLLWTALPIEPSCAENVTDALSVGIQSTKTVVIQPLDPKERDMLSIYDLVYESLVTIDDNYLPQPYLAERWEHTSDGKTWTFYLHKDVTFSDGTPLTARDVVASAQTILDRARDENTTDQGFYVNLKYFITTITAKDDYTVVIKANRKYYGLLYGMTFPVVPADQVAQDNPVGSGPYVISTFAAGDYMWLQANPHWWQMQPQVKDIMVYLRQTSQEVIESYEYANVNTIFTRSLAATQYRSSTNALSITYRTNQLEMLCMNNHSKELTKNVRMAIRYAIDPDKIISNVYSNMAIATDTPMYPGTWMYNDSLAPYFLYNPDEARRLLEAEGWEDSDEDGILDRLNNEGKPTNLHLSFYVYEEPDNNVRMEAANMIADMLAEVGISTKINLVSMTSAKEKLSAGSFDLALIAFAMDTCPDPGFLLMKRNTGNYSRYASDRMEELFNKLRKTVTQEEYRSVLYQIQERFAEDCPFVCLYYRTGSILTRYMYTTTRDIREYELLSGIELFRQ